MTEIHRTFFRQFTTTEKIPSLSFEDNNLGNFLYEDDERGIISETIFEAKQIKQGQKKGEEAKQTILFAIGPPGSGKSWTVRRIGETIETLAKQLQVEAGVDFSLHHLHWDKNEDYLIAKDVLHPHLGQPFSNNDLRTNGMYTDLLLAYLLRGNNKVPFKEVDSAIKNKRYIKRSKGEMTADAQQHQLSVLNETIFERMLDDLEIRDKKPSIIIVENPGATAFRDARGDWTPQTRQYNASLFDDFLQGKFPFHELDRNRFRVGYCGFVSGPRMTILNLYRSELQATHDITQGNELNARYGLAPFEHSSEYKAAQGGANFPMMKRASTAIHTTFKSMLFSRHEMVQEQIEMLPEYVKYILRNTTKAMGDRSGFVQGLKNILEQHEEEQEQWNAFQADAGYVAQFFGKKDLATFAIPLCFDYAVSTVLFNNSMSDPEKKAEREIILYNNPPVNVQDEITKRSLYFDIPW